MSEFIDPSLVNFLGNQTPIEEQLFEPVTSVILGAASEITSQQRQEAAITLITPKPELQAKVAGMALFAADVDGRRYIVTSYPEERTTTHNFREIAVARRGISAGYGTGAGLIHTVRAVATRRRNGLITIANHGDSDTYGCISYLGRRGDQGYINYAAYTPGGIQDPEVFADVIKKANFEETVGLENGLTQAEAQRLTQAHAPLIKVARLLIARDGTTGEESSTRTVEFNIEDGEELTIGNEATPLIQRCYTDAQGNKVLETFRNFNQGDHSYMTLFHVEINGQERMPEFGGFHPTSPAAIEHLTRIIGSHYVETA